MNQPDFSAVTFFYHSLVAGGVTVLPWTLEICWRCNCFFRVILPYWVILWQQKSLRWKVLLHKTTKMFLKLLLCSLWWLSTLMESLWTTQIHIPLHSPFHSFADFVLLDAYTCLNKKILVSPTWPLSIYRFQVNISKNFSFMGMWRKELFT